MENCRADAAFRRYSKLVGLESCRKDADIRTYDLSYRLKLADVVAAEGNNGFVTDLGSEYGGMSYALLDAGVNVVSAEYENSKCKNELQKINPGNVVRCDVFRSPFRSVQDGYPKSPAAVSYMFLGWFVPEELAKGRSLAGVFGGLPFQKIYSVELQFEYSSWFARPERLKRAVVAGRRSGWSKVMELLEPSEIKLKLEEALPEWDMEDLGSFGARSLEGKSYDRLGFKFTRKRGK